MLQDSLSKQAYNSIKEMIIKCILPPGSITSEQYFVDKLAMSRTPIRSALLQLKNENLLQIMPKKGILISRLTLDQVQFNFEARNALELYITKKYGNRIDQAVVQNLYERLKADVIPLAENFAIDTELHRAIVNCAENRHTIELIAQLMEKQTRLGHFIRKSMSQERANKINQEHRNIAENLVIGDIRSASQFLKEHLESALYEAQKALIKHENETVL